MSPYVGIALLDALYLAVGFAVVAGIGVARTPRALALHAGLALVVGWALMGTVASMLLIAGLSAAVWQVVLCAAVVVAAALPAARRVASRPARVLGAEAGWQTWIAVGGGALLLVYLEALFRR